jgi:Fic family protein
MERFVREISSPEFAAAHPIIQAAFAHYVLVAIHPFADGNGRVARALGVLFGWQSCSGSHSLAGNE